MRAIAPPAPPAPSEQPSRESASRESVSSESASREFVSREFVSSESASSESASSEPADGFAPRVWSVVKASIAPAGRSREEEFNGWYNTQHVPEWVAQPGFIRAWRLRALHDHPAQRQPHQHGYCAVYELHSVAAFNNALAASHGAPWGPWQEYVGTHLIDWERTYYRTLAALAPDDGQVDAPYWAIVKTDFHGTPAQEAEFNRWYNQTHFPELVAHEGFQGGWRLQVLPDPGDLGPRRQRYWAVYRVASPEHFQAARAERAARGLGPWDGLWSESLRDTRIDHYAMVHHQAPHQGHQA